MGEQAHQREEEQGAEDEGEGQPALVAAQARGDEAPQLPHDQRQCQDHHGHHGDLKANGEPGDGAGDHHSLA